MDLTVKEYLDGLLSEEAHQRSSDDGKVDDLELKMHLPEWFDEEKYNQARRFFWDFRFSFIMNMIFGLVALFTVPSILTILVDTRRSNSTYTSYKRYISTMMHVISWHECDLKPGTKSWLSLQTVRARHLRAGVVATLRGHGTISQRDMALTLFGFTAFALLKPDKISIRQIKAGDWESYNHFWRTIGYMIGLEDRYNLCRKNVDETREVCRILLENVFTPGLENVPEYFEHTARVMLEGQHIVNDAVEPSSVIFMTRNLAGVPGYVYTEQERIDLQNKLKEHLKGKSEDIGVDRAVFISRNALDGLPKRSPRMLYVQDFDTLDTTPAYKQLNFTGRYRLTALNIMFTIYNTEVGRYLINLMSCWNLYITFNFPYKAFMRFGFKKSFVNMFKEGPKDDTEPKLNSEYEKPPPPETWYEKLFTIIW